MRSMIVIAVSLCAAIGACAAEKGQEDVAVKLAGSAEIQREYLRQEPFIRRAFVASVDGRWIGNAVCYGPHRDGQSPDGASPTREELLEDLKIMSGHWKMFRMYGSRGATETVLQIIRDEGLGLRVVVGAWVETEMREDEEGQVVERFPEAVINNRAEVETAIRLANEYPRIVAAVTVGNETHVSWSFHKVRTPTLVNYIRQVRAQTDVPVSTADVSSYWAKPESKALADEMDFIVTHIYAMWNKQSLDDAMAWTQEQYALNVERHRDHRFVIGEAGWATVKHNEGEQATLIVGEAGENSQQQFHRDFTAWVTENQIPNFFFEAFDENWKGGEHPNEVEKHWGLFNADRTPKQALREGADR